MKHTDLTTGEHHHHFVNGQCVVCHRPNMEDLTADILKEFDKEFGIYQNGIVQEDLFIPPTTTLKEVKDFLLKALQQQKEQIVKQLRMEKKPHEELMMNRHIDYNSAVDKFNSKLDNL